MLCTANLPDCSAKYLNSRFRELIMRKAQINMVPIYILGSIVLLLVMAFGYNAISRIGETGAQISSLKLVEELKADIKSMSLDYGSSKAIDYRLPEGISEVCFTDPAGSPLLVPASSCSNANEHPTAALFSQDAPGKNVFFIGGTLKGSDRIENLHIGGCTFLCFKAFNGKISMRMEGLGDKALIKRLD